MESDGEGQGQGPFSEFLSWESEDMVMPEIEKGIKRDLGSFERESKELALEDLSMLSSSQEMGPVTSLVLALCTCLRGPT